MIFGMLAKSNTHTATDQTRLMHTANELWSDGRAALAADAARHSALFVGDQVVLAWQGIIHNHADLLQQWCGVSAAEAKATDLVEAAARLLSLRNDAVLAQFNGQFAFALYDHASGSLTLGRDQLGIGTLYYADQPDVTVFATQIRPIARHPAVTTRLNYDALQRYLTFNYNPGWSTFYTGIKKIRPAHIITVSAGNLSERRYWQLSFAQTQQADAVFHAEHIRELLKSAVAMRTSAAQSLGIFVSGGLDSSTVASLSREAYAKQLHTFSYRCLGNTFDESHYARTMGSYCDAVHHEVLYAPEDVLNSAELVVHMQEPFADVGINMATYLLGRVAATQIDDVFTGDGGDELFGGHPVYVADKGARFIDWLPRRLQTLLFAPASLFADSDQKLTTPIKLKRFAESLSHPAELGTQRWRAYYTLNELQRLLNAPIDANAIYGDIITLNAEADGHDTLSRSLYADFQSVLRFSLRRMDLVRSFDITPHFPLLDHRLVEYSTTIPSKLKLRRISDAKYIERVAVEPFLPREIAHRKDKLGHSIPFKNWLRTHKRVQTFVLDSLHSTRLSNIGIGRTMIDTMWQDHMHLRKNNSHRLWALTVLDLWLANNPLT